MITISTPQGKQIDLTWERELRSPVQQGEHVRAYCHIHGSDHQRSLSITRATGWGHCFNAACGATVLVAEWNSLVANRLMKQASWGRTSLSQPSFPQSSRRKTARPAFVQPMLLPPPRPIPSWQQEEREALQTLERQMRHALMSTPRAKKYLHERGIPLALAMTSGAGYLPTTLLREPGMREHRRLLYRWVERLLFPLISPDGQGYIGRSLWQWQPGMKETSHKRLLEQEASPKRWIKTNPAGWFGVEFEQLPRSIILVEGAFDRLTLLTAGLQANEVVALVGTTSPLEWLPAQVKTVVLALDGDEGGRAASNRLAHHLTQAGVIARICPCIQDRWGKDWNERWQRIGSTSVAPVAEMLAEARSA